MGSNSDHVWNLGGKPNKGGSSKQHRGMFGPCCFVNRMFKVLYTLQSDQAGVQQHAHTHLHGTAAPQNLAVWLAPQNGVATKTAFCRASRTPPDPIYQVSRQNIAAYLLQN